MWDGLSRLFWFAFPWWLRVLNISLSASQPFTIPHLRILCLAPYPFLIGLFGSLESNFLSSFHILNISPLPDVELVKVFSQFVGCLFVLLTVLCLTEALQFYEAPFINSWHMLHYVHSSLIYNSQKLERTQMSVNRMDKVNLVHLNNEILFSH